MLLLAYHISPKGQNVFQLKKWTAGELSGNAPYLYSVNPVAGYDDITGILTWDQIGRLRFSDSLDYLKINEQIRNVYNIDPVFSNYSIEERKTLGKLNIVPNADRLTVYTPEELKEVGSLHEKYLIKAREKRAKIAQQIISQNLTVPQAYAVVQEIEDNRTFDKYQKYGFQGSQEDGTLAIFDYLYGRVGTSYDGVGLLQKPFTPATGITMLQMCDEIYNELRYIY